MLDSKPEDVSAILNQILVPVTVSEVLKDGSFRFLSINTAHTEMSGLTQDGFIGRGVTDLLPEPEATAVLSRYGTARDSAQVLNYEECLTLPNGPSWWRTSINPVQNNAGEVRRLYVTSIPIDHERRMRQLAQHWVDTVSPLRQAQAAVTQGVRGTSHSLEAIARMASTLLMPGSDLSPDERRLAVLVQRLAAAADISLKHIQTEGQGKLADVLEQALLDQGELAALLEEAGQEMSDT